MIGPSEIRTIFNCDMKHAVRILGALTLLFLAFFVWVQVVVSPRRLGPLTPEEQLRTVAFDLLVLATGVGLIFLQRWAALILTAALLLFASWMIVGSLSHALAEPELTPFMLINVAVALVTASPVLIIKPAWNEMNWGWKKGPR